MDEEQDRRADFVKWIIFEVIIPITVFIVIAFAGTILLQLPRCHWRIGSDGDLLLFSALLILGVYLRLEHFRLPVTRTNSITAMHFVRYMPLGLAVVFFILFGLVRLYMLDGKLFSAVNVDARVYVVFALNVAILLLAVVASYYAYVMHLKGSGVAAEKADE